MLALHFFLQHKCHFVSDFKNIKRQGVKRNILFQGWDVSGWYQMFDIWMFKSPTNQGLWNPINTDQQSSPRLLQRSYSSAWFYPKNHWTLQWMGLELYRRALGPQNNHFWGVRILRVRKSSCMFQKKMGKIITHVTEKLVLLGNFNTSSKWHSLGPFQQWLRLGDAKYSRLWWLASRGSQVRSPGPMA